MEEVSCAGQSTPRPTQADVDRRLMQPWKLAAGDTVPFRKCRPHLEGEGNPQAKNLFARALPLLIVTQYVPHGPYRHGVHFSGARCRPAPADLRVSRHVVVVGWGWQ